ncbi:hypothetical protein M1D83_03955 [Enterobacteriaceae bacterium]
MTVFAVVGVNIFLVEDFADAVVGVLRVTAQGSDVLLLLILIADDNGALLMAACMVPSECLLLPVPISITLPMLLAISAPTPPVLNPPP